ncbi:MAG: hypothetical protein ACOY46_09395 [Bacillota bacterium]
MRDFLFYLMQGIPEMTGVAAFCLALAGVLNWRKAIGIGILMALVIYIIRSFQISFGIHSAIGIITLGLILVKTTGMSFSRGFILSACGFFAIAVLEYACTQVIFNVFALDKEVAKNTFIWKIIGLPQAVLMIALALAVSKIRAKDSDPKDGLPQI